MEGKDFLTVANKFCESPHEAERRTAVSRAYYALFNHVKRSLEIGGVSINRNAEAHDQVYRYLNNSNIENARTVALALSSLREIRNDADYNLHTGSFDPNNCRLHYKKAENSLSRFDDVDLKKLINDIDIYKKAVRENG